MGIFRDLRALKRQVNELERESGVDTSLRALLRQTPGLLSQTGQALGQLGQVHDGKAEGERLRAEGRAETARLLAVRDTGMTISGTGLGQENAVADLDLEVRPEGGEPYRATIRQLIPRLAVGRLIPGSELPVKVDRDDPAKLVVDWEAPVL